MIAWSDIKAECDGYRAGFVAVFRKYEGQDTDRKDAQGRAIKVTRRSFASIVLKVDDTTFGNWIKNAENGAPLSGRQAGSATGSARTGQVGRQIAKSPAVSVEDKVGMLSDLMSDPKVMHAYHEAQRTHPRRPLLVEDIPQRTDDDRAQSAANTLAVLILREQRGAWNPSRGPSRTTHAVLHFLGELLSERTLPASVTDALIAEIEDDLRAKAER